MIAKLGKTVIRHDEHEIKISKNGSVAALKTALEIANPMVINF